MANEFKADPENYYKMSEPFESVDLANEAMQGFHDELGELRKKYRIRDLLVVVYGGTKYKDGETGDFMNCHFYGNQLHTLPMAAYAYGEEKKTHNERMAKLLSDKK